MRKHSRTFLLATAIMAIPSALAVAAGEYTITRIGYTGGVYQGSDSRESSTVSAVTPGGLVIGTSTIYQSTTATGTGSLGTDAWVYDANADTTTRLGLYSSTPDAYGVAYVNSIGVRSTTITITNTVPGIDATNAGYFFGKSNRYVASSTTSLGTDAWVYHAGTNTLIGLTAAPTATAVGYVNSTGSRTVSLIALNAVGNAVGTTNRFDTAGTALGNDAWIYRNGTTTAIGLAVDGSETGTTYLRTVSTSTLPSATINPAAVNVSGQVTGISTVFPSGQTNANNIGFDAWIYDPTAGTTTRIGLFGTTPISENINGGANTMSFENGTSRFSSVSKINDAGQVVGFSTSYGAYAGNMTWIYTPANDTTPASTVPVGLYDASHVSTAGAYISSTSSSTYNLNKIGQVVGTSNNYNGTSTSVGVDAWLYTPGTGTVQVSPTTGYFNTSTGSRTVLISNLTDGTGSGGQIAGTATRFSATNTSVGTDVWYYNSAVASPVTKIVNLTAANASGTPGITYESTAATPLRAGAVSVMNNTGEIAGTSTRYSGTTTKGTDAWIYVTATDTTYSINLSVASDGTASSTVKYLSDSGYGFGIFTKFTGTTQNAGTFGFLWSPVTHTAIDMNLNVTNLSADGWSQLMQTFQILSSGTILSYAVKSTDPVASSQTVTLLKPNGDADQNGLFGMDDYLAIDVGYSEHLTGWSNGDFNLDGTVDYKDYAILDASYASSHPLSAESLINLHYSEFGQTYLDALQLATVPEPGSLAMLGCGMALCLRRRFSRRS